MRLGWPGESGPDSLLTLSVLTPPASHQPVRWRWRAPTVLPGSALLRCCGVLSRVLRRVSDALKRTDTPGRPVFLGSISVPLALCRNRTKVVPRSPTLPSLPESFRVG